MLLVAAANDLSECPRLLYILTLRHKARCGYGKVVGFIYRHQGHKPQLTSIAGSAIILSRDIWTFTLAAAVFTFLFAV